MSLLERFRIRRRKRVHLARGTGLVAPDPHDPRDFELDRLGLAEPMDGYADLTVRIKSVLSQGPTNTCVANAWEQARLMEAIRLGYAPSLRTLSSRLFGYYNARAEHWMAKHDAGTFLRTYAKALKRFGNCAESEWQFNKTRINRRPNAIAFRNAVQARGMRGYYRIFDVGDKRLRAINAALESRRPVVFGTRIDEDFKLDDGPDVVSVPTGKFVGGHAMCVVGYKRVGGSNHYRIINSWGADWRECGFVWFDEEYMTWMHTVDLWVVDLGSP